MPATSRLTAEQCGQRTLMIESAEIVVTNAATECYAGFPGVCDGLHFGHAMSRPAAVTFRAAFVLQ